MRFQDIAVDNLHKILLFTPPRFTVTLAVTTEWNSLSAENI